MGHYIIESADWEYLHSLREYQVARLAGDDPGQKAIIDLLYEKLQERYYWIARSVWKKCRLKNEDECVGRLPNRVWYDGTLYPAAYIIHITAMENYHLIPGKMQKEVFNNTLIPRVSPENGSFLKEIYQLNPDGKMQILNEQLEQSTRLYRWDIAVKSNFCYSKFVYFAVHIICRKNLPLNCSRKCHWLREYRARIKTLPKTTVQYILHSADYSDKEKELVKNLYKLQEKTGFYKLKDDRTPGQVAALCNLLRISDVPLRDEDRALAVMDFSVQRLEEKEIYNWILEYLDNLTQEEWNIVFLFMKKETQRKISELLKLTEATISRRIQRIERELTEQIRNWLGVHTTSLECVTLKSLRACKGFLLLFKKKYPENSREVN